MKKLLLTGIAVLLMATGTSHAQQFIGGSGDYGRRHSYQGSSVRFTPSEAACYRANYASTLAMQRCADRVIARLSAGSKGAADEKAALSQDCCALDGNIGIGPIFWTRW